MCNTGYKLNVTDTNQCIDENIPDPVVVTTPTPTTTPTINPTTTPTTTPDPVVETPTTETPPTTTEVPADSEAELSGNLGTITGATILSSVGLTVGLSAISGNPSSPQVLFVLFGFYQLLLFSLLLQFEIPEVYSSFLSPFEFVALNFEFLNHIPFIKWMSDRFNLPVHGAVDLEKIGVDDNTFLNNYFSTLIVMVVLILFHLMFYILYIILKPSLDGNT